MNQGKNIPFATPVFFTLIFLMATFKVFNLDIWWHMEAGEFILKNLTIPRHDIYSHTSSGEPWIPTQWLFQIVAYAIYALGGINVLIIAKATLVTITFYIILKTLREWDIPDSISVTLLIFLAAVSRFRFFLRPDVTSFFFMALEIYLLCRWRKRGDNFSFCLLPINMLVWANMHSGATLGVALLALFAFSSAIESMSPNKNNYPPFKKTIILITISLLVTLANPNGMGLYLFALEHYDIYDKIGIGESMPPGFAEFPLYFFLLLPVCLAHLLSMRRLPLFSILVLILFTHLSLKTARMIGWWGIAVAPSTVFAFHLLISDLAKKFPSLKIAIPLAVRAFFLIIVMASVFYLEVFHLKGYHNDIDFGLGTKKGKYPEKAVDFVLKNDLKGNMYNDQDFGGYILWRVFPERKVFFDPRMQVYYKLFPEFDDWPGLLEKYSINYAILEYPDTFTFRETPFPEGKWSLVYWDDTAMVYVRKNAANAHVIGKHGNQFLTRPYDEALSYADMAFKYPAFLHKMKKELERNTSSTYRKKILLSTFAWKTGRINDALTYLFEAVKEEPKKQNAYYHLGILLLKAGKKSQGKAYLEKCRHLASYSKYGKLAAIELGRIGDV